MNAEPGTNKTIHALIMTCFATFHMQDSEQYAISTEASVRLQLYVSMKQVKVTFSIFFSVNIACSPNFLILYNSCKSYKESKKLGKQAILSETKN